MDQESARAVEHHHKYNETEYTSTVMQNQRLIQSNKQGKSEVQQEDTEECSFFYLRAESSNGALLFAFSKGRFSSSPGRPCSLERAPVHKGAQEKRSQVDFKFKWHL